MKFPFFSKMFHFHGDSQGLQSSQGVSVRRDLPSTKPLGEQGRSYNDISELPPFRELLTASGNAQFTVQESLHQCVAALCQKSAALLLATDEFRSTNEYLSMRQHLTAAYPSVIEAITIPAVLLSLYSGVENQGKRSDRKEGDEALSIKLFQRIATKAIRERCSDVHIVILDEAQSAVVLFRIDGVIHLSERIPQSHATSAVSVAFTKLAEKGSRSEGAFNQSMDQSAMIPIEFGTEQYKLRYQSLTVSGGFKVVLRTLQTTYSKDAEAKSLDELGYSADQCRSLYAAARKTAGLIVITGPTGSGKSTTLKTLMTHSPTRHQRIQYSIEDPVEYKIFGVSQKSLQRGANDDDTTAIIAATRSVLRGDPDELMVGEVRDSEMASLLTMFVQSGHQCMASVHAASGIDIIARLTSEGIRMPRDAFGSRNFLSALVYQRLIPLLCEHCRVPSHEATDVMLPAYLRDVLRNRFALDPDRMYVTNPHGCDKCGNTGTHGRTVIAEVIRSDLHMRKCFREARDDDAEILWRANRTASFDEPDCTGKTALEHGLYKASIGLIDPVVLDAMTEPLDDYQIYPIKGRA